MFKRLDKDGDGKLTIDEYRGKKEASEVEAKFKGLDKDNDGKLSAEEFAAGAAKAPKK
jgi:Ca2+-binding EF-hand superfamily protein